MSNNFRRKVLKNGMTILFEKRDLPIVSVAFAVRSGGTSEDISKKGISHYIEHMLYKGTPSRNAKKIAEEIEKKGGELNGFTDENITAYWCKIPSQHLNVALEVLSDMVKNPLFDEKELEKERKVIFEEIKMRKDRPNMYVMDKIQSFLYEGTLGLDVAGTYDTMNSITREEIVSRFKEIYSPNNMIMCVIGDANFEEIVKFAEDNFGNEKGKVPEFEIKLKNDSKIETRKAIDQANLVFAYHVPLAADEKAHAAHVLMSLMAGGMSSRLFSEIREKRNLAYAVKGDSNINSNFAYSFVYVGTTKENVEKVKDLMLKEFKTVSEELTEEELKQTKNQLVGNYQISQEDSQNQMVNLLAYELNGNAEDFYEFEKNILNVNLKDVKDLANIENYSFFALVPEDKS